jgi:hypothetical protein
MRLNTSVIFNGAALALTALLLATPAHAQTTGSLRGTVKDVSGAVIPHATVIVINTATSAQRDGVTDDQGAYAFTLLPIGRYDLEITFPGFAPFRRNALVIDVSSALQIDATLQVAGQTESVTVTESVVRVETAQTALGETIKSEQVVAVPLNGRSYTDLLSVQAGVTPISTNANVNQSSGGAFGAIAVSGDLNPGQFSINGQRETANAFVLNGSNVQEDMAGGAAVIPNLDSIAEFRILSSNFEAEYGNYSGGLVTVITKSGTNQLHGSGFEFLRNTRLDAKGFFDPKTPAFDQHQFGGTIGGPVKRDKIFFFADYQGGRTRQGIETGLIAVPSLQDRAGDLSDISSSLTGSVNGNFMAQLLSQRLGYGVSPNEPFYFPGCSSSAQCVFPGAVIPQSAWSVPAQRLLGYIPLPNGGPGTFSSGSEAQHLHDDKGAVRLEANTSVLGLLSGYYFVDRYHLNSPYPTQQGGANVPGFNALGDGRADLLTLSSSRIFGATTVNELRVSYLRNHNHLGQAQGGVGTSLDSQGFLPASAGGFSPGFPKYQGVTTVLTNSFTFGTTPFANDQVSGTYQIMENLSKVIGNHTAKLGGQYRLIKVKQDVNLIANGELEFFGTTTGSDFADYLLGFPTLFSQQSTPEFNERSAYTGVYAQDSWRIRNNLTLNYGLRWDWIRPWSEDHLQTSTLIPGVQSQKFPGAPRGYLLPGDRLPDGSVVPSTIAPTPKNDLAPRFGIAYSPAWSEGWLGALSGGAGKSSVRAGWGKFFTAVEGLTVAYPTGNPPYGLTYVSPEPPLFEAPFIGAQTGTAYPQQFPVNVPPYTITPGNPDRRDWSGYTPINGAVSYYYQNKTPYTEQYYLSLQRQLGTRTVLTASYIGSQGHNQLVLLAANPGDPALCLSVSQADQVMPGTATCGPFGENGVYTRRDGTVINGTRHPFGNDIGSDAYFMNMGNSHYNSLQMNVTHVSGRLSFLGSYTLAKSVDWGSSIQEQVYPYDYKLRAGPSAFDIRHNFVVTYRYELPLDRLFGENRAATGWAISGVTRLSSGLPVTLFSFNDRSLINSQNQGVNGIGSDLPNYTPGDLRLNHNPANGQPYFNTSLFSPAALGAPGNAPRRFFYGPGIENFDMALIKSVRLTDGKSLELRFEAFNVFNRPQFYGSSSVDGNIDSATFGRVTNAAAPRICQIAMKVHF